VHRANSGFDIRQLAGEYRALRASVLSLWSDTAEADALHLRDMIRFNEAIDQALAESIGFFTDQVEQARNLLLGIVSHDMRSPLQTIRLTAECLSARNSGMDASNAAQLLIDSGGRMQALLGDLVDFNRSNLGLGIPIVTNEVDVAGLFTGEMKLLWAAYPDRRLELTVVGDTRGVWDGRACGSCWATW
jgi:signal transduction histidine kinase